MTVRVGCRSVCLSTPELARTENQCVRKSENSLARRYIDTNRCRHHINLQLSLFARPTTQPTLLVSSGSLSLVEGQRILVVEHVG